MSPHPNFTLALPFTAWGVGQPGGRGSLGGVGQPGGWASLGGGATWGEGQPGWEG